MGQLSPLAPRIYQIQHCIRQFPFAPRAVSHSLVQWGYLFPLFICQVAGIRLSSFFFHVSILPLSFAFVNTASKTVAFAWVKQNKKANTLFWGMGYWTRANVELCILATKGRPRRKSAGVHQVVLAPVEEHSKKPDIVRDKIVTLMGDLPRIELFARQTPPGWDVWGNEVDSDITL